MLTNDQMIPNRFARRFRAKKIYRDCLKAWDMGLDVYVCTYTKATKYSPKHRDMITISKSGMSILTRHGRNWLNADYCKFTAR